jgi:hypothetical protein
LARTVRVNHTTFIGQKNTATVFGWLCDQVLPVAAQIKIRIGAFPFIHSEMRRDTRKRVGCKENITGPAAADRATGAVFMVSG